MSTDSVTMNNQMSDDLFLFPKQNAGFQIPFFISTETEAQKVRPPPVVKSLEERIEELTPKQKETLQTFRETVKASSWYNAEEHNDWTLIRYLIARNFDQKKSLTMLEKSTMWRKENDVYNWKCETCLKDPNHHMMQFVGWDLLNQPVCFMAMRWGPERKAPLRHCVCAFNHMVQLMPVGVEKWVCVTDFETYSHLRDSSPKMGSSVINTIQDHYPERLGMMILVNPPKAFSLLWKLFSPVIDEKTKMKVRFLYTNSKPHVKDEFPKIFPPLLCEYLYESYQRSKRAELPSTPIWYPNAHLQKTSSDTQSSGETNLNNSLDIAPSKAEQDQ